jgi:hypothetical protein
MQGDGQQAVVWLQKALDKGFGDLSLLKNDPNLDPVRGTAALSSLIARLENSEASRQNNSGG